MRRVSVVATVLASVVLSGCGTQEGASDGGSGPAESAGDGGTSSGAARAWRDCTPDAFEAAGGASKTLRHDGAQTELELKVPEDGPCAGALVASGPSGVVGVDAKDAELDGDTAKALDAGDLGDNVLVRVDGGVHPRGGFQPHLYLVGPDTIREVTVNGQPVVPFVATDGGMAPMTVRCGDGTIAVVSATTAEPPGVIMAWDVQTTTYTLSADGAREQGAGSLQEDVAEPVLRRDMPELFAPGHGFAGC
jgi:hypothetical protein